MLSPNIAIWILVGFIVLFAVVLPILNIKFSQYISLRWMCLVVILALLVGVVVDFVGLDDTSRHIVILGGVVIAGLYVLARSLEKALYNGWLGKGSIKLSAEKGDLKGSVEYTPNEKNNKKS